MLVSTQTSPTQKKVVRFIQLLSLTVTLVNFTGCNPRTLPGIRGFVRREGERISKATEEAVKKSPTLQQLDQLCREEVSTPDDFLLQVRSMGTSNIFLSYGYRSKSEYEDVKKFYKARLGLKEWKLITRKGSRVGTQVFRVH